MTSYAAWLHVPEEVAEGSLLLFHAVLRIVHDDVEIARGVEEEPALVPVHLIPAMKVLMVSIDDDMLSISIPSMTAAEVVLPHVPQSALGARISALASC